MTRADRLRPGDLAREHGLSAQAVRNYEDDGILPPAPRGDHGYRHYTPVHAQALRAFLTLRPGFGHQGAAAILRAANAGDEEAVLRLVERGHAEMLRDRGTLDEAAAALAALAPQDDRPTRGAPSVGALAHQLGIHPATLRKWERAGILHAERDSVTGYRRYPPAAVRDAHLARQLRRGGYPLSQIAAAVARVREAGGVGPLEEALGAWRSRLRLRGRAMLDGTAELSAYLRLRGL
ncbi:MerR family transcriptional regulator [Nonomuraea sp. CA-218870]|uniref:MerR family transcriptional regulator n=1 Tax=Nonomuraea sp. CA-218870 TaxID=3239998 RepID=UPI003D8A2EF8